MSGRSGDTALTPGCTDFTTSTRRKRILGMKFCLKGNVKLSSYSRHVDMHSRGYVYIHMHMEKKRNGEYNVYIHESCKKGLWRFIDRRKRDRSYNNEGNKRGMRIKRGGYGLGCLLKRNRYMQYNANSIILRLPQVDIQHVT